MKRPLQTPAPAVLGAAVAVLWAGGPAGAQVHSDASPPAAPAAVGEGAPARPTSQAACGTSVAERIEGAYERWTALLERRGSLGGEAFGRRADSLVAQVVDVEAIAARVLRDDWRGMSRHRKREFTAALTRSLRGKLVSSFASSPPGSTPWLQAAEVDAAGNGAARADYWLVRGQRTEPLSFVLAQDPEGRCRIVDVEWAGTSFADTTRTRVRRMVDDYSFAHMIGELGDYGYVVLEDFEDDSVGTLPRGWGWKDSDDDEHKPYEVREENGNKYLAARDEGESVILGKEIKWDLEKYPYVSFRVRVHEIPPGGDERLDRKVDSAAGLYFTYRKKMLGLIPEPVKYVWSSTLPVGAATIRGGIGRPWQVVFGSGREGLGEWRTYVFDLRQAYRDTFGGSPPSKPIGIGVLSDANSVGGRAYADYDEIRALRSAPPGTGSGVTQILESPSR